MDIRKLQRAIVDGLEDVKGQNILVFNTEHLSALFERVIIASGTSNRQTKSLAASVRDAVKGVGMPPPRTEGEVNGEWIIVDCGAAVVHVMQPAIREYYHLEEIWGDKPVKMKIDTAVKGLVKAAEPEKPVRAKAAVDKAGPGKAASGKAAGQTLAKRVAAKQAAAKAPAKSPAKSSAGKAPAKKPVVAAKKAITRTVGTKSPAVRTLVVNAPGAKKAASPKAAAPRKSPAAKVPAKKLAAKKSPVRKAAASATPARKAPARKPATRA